MHFHAVLLVAAAVPALTLASNITAWDNLGCSGSRSAFPCDGSCHSFVGKRAFTTVAGTEHCVAVFSDAACTSLLFPTFDQAGQCTNIESGNPILAFSCSADNTCPS
ncbi:hypothetical protein DFH09DRAFT_295768 [Mycena vulgaris]|nr:hypothetical protein DFH09DRAFT_418435 [Mycena vulgaris]KAJ6502957.1 hypothetical protein DFH09DRAFT_295768 [Mycena vulgaris]